MDKIIRIVLTVMVTAVFASMFFATTDSKIIIGIGIFVSVFITILVFHYKKTKLTILNIIGWILAIILGFGHIPYPEQFSSVTGGLGGLISIVIMMLLILHKPKLNPVKNELA